MVTIATAAARDFIQDDHTRSSSFSENTGYTSVLFCLSAPLLLPKNLKQLFSKTKFTRRGTTFLLETTFGDVLDKQGALSH